jgi:hypothetical protein
MNFQNWLSPHAKRMKRREITGSVFFPAIVIRDLQRAPSAEKSSG